MRLLLLTPLLLAACAAGPSVRPGVTSAHEVKRTMGAPALEWSNPDGSRQLAYPKGYYSNRTYMVHVGRDGLVQGVEQVLKDDRFYRIRPGQTRDDILRLIGPPIETMEFPRLQQVAWDYRFEDTWGYTAILSVMIDQNGIVVGRSTRRLDRGDDKGRQ